MLSICLLLLQVQPNLCLRNKRGTGLTNGRGGLTDGRGGLTDGRGGLTDGRGGLTDGRGGLTDGRGGLVKRNAEAGTGEENTPRVVNV